MVLHMQVFLFVKRHFHKYIFLNNNSFLLLTLIQKHILVLWYSHVYHIFSNKTGNTEQAESILFSMNYHCENSPFYWISVYMLYSKFELILLIILTLSF